MILEAETFRFTAYSYDEGQGVLTLSYACDDKYNFTEKISFLGQREVLTESSRKTLNMAFRALHLAAGVSYYKAFLCPKIKVETAPLTYNEAVFFKDFYVKGLGEFSYRNDIEIKPEFVPEAKNYTPEDVPLKKGIVVPVGGGKDSALTIELLLKAGYKPRLFAVGEHRAIRDVMEVSGLESIKVKREISPLLFELNQNKNTFNGHVPVTGILSFVMVAASIIYGFDTVVMSNERSANVGNLKSKGREINHQWSKSYEFETSFSNYVKQNISPEFNYFSLLRPFSELEIAKRFAELTKYHSVFTSCNMAFKIDENKRIDCWCGVCDKCRFVFLALAPFMEKEKLIAIFGNNLLDDATEQRGYEELLGLASYKPFECVGEIEESAAAMALLAGTDEWKDDYIIQTLWPKVEAKFGDCQKLIRKAFTRSRRNNVPKEFLDALK